MKTKAFVAGFLTAAAMCFCASHNYKSINENPDEGFFIINDTYSQTGFVCGYEDGEVLYKTHDGIWSAVGDPEEFGTLVDIKFNDAGTPDISDDIIVQVKKWR